MSQHSSGHGSSSTEPVHFRPYVILGYICGFNGKKNPLRCMIENKLKEIINRPIQEVIEDPSQWFRIENSLIQELDDDVYGTLKK